MGAIQVVADTVVCISRAGDHLGGGSSAIGRDCVLSSAVLTHGLSSGDVGSLLVAAGRSSEAKVLRLWCCGCLFVR